MSAEERHRLITEIARKFVGEALAPILRRLDALEARMQGRHEPVYMSVAEGAHDRSAWVHAEASER